jgi:hypothetical protein
VTVIVRHCKLGDAGVVFDLPVSNTGDRNYTELITSINDCIEADFKDKFVLVNKGTSLVSCRSKTRGSL